MELHLPGYRYSSTRMAVRAPYLFTAVRSQFSTTNEFRNSNSYSLSRFSISKPLWIVRTESNVRKEKRKRPHPRCVVCKGSGIVNCHFCSGKGRTNFVNSELLPKGEWPKWCKSCGGSGIEQCCRCLGSGEFRGIMGFNFMNIGTKHTHSQT